MFRYLQVEDTIGRGPPGPGPPIGPPLAGKNAGSVPSLQLCIRPCVGSVPPPVKRPGPVEAPTLLVLPSGYCCIALLACSFE